MHKNEKTIVVFSISEKKFFLYKSDEINFQNHISSFIKIRFFIFFTKKSKNLIFYNFYFSLKIYSTIATNDYSLTTTNYSLTTTTKTMNTYYVKGATPYSAFVIKTTDMGRDEFKKNLRAGNFTFTEVAQNGMEFKHILKYKNKVPRATGSCFKCLIEHEGDMQQFLYEMSNESTAQTQENVYGSITFVRPTPEFLARKQREMEEWHRQCQERHNDFHNRCEQRRTERDARMNASRAAFHHNRPVRQTVVNHHHHYNRDNNFKRNLIKYGGDDGEAAE